MELGNVVMADERDKEQPEVRVQVDHTFMIWPANGPVQLGYDSNRMYEDLTGADWEDVDRVVMEESRLLARIASAADPEALLEAVEEDWCALVGLLDRGVARTQRRREPDYSFLRWPRNWVSLCSILRKTSHCPLVGALCDPQQNWTR